MKNLLWYCAIVFLAACGFQKDNQLHKAPLQPTDFFEEFSDAADRLIQLSPNGLAIGEVHGQREGVEFMKAAVKSAVDRGLTVLLLLEISPSEAGLDVSSLDLGDYRAIDMSDKTLPFWTQNLDMRASWELYDYLVQVSGRPNIEVSYFMDSRLNPGPNRLKAHGLAERWNIAKQARPEHYVISWSGNYHTSVNQQYPLDVTNSMCRYLLETYDYAPTCMSVDSFASTGKNCADNVKAKLIEGPQVHEPWDYVVWHPDRCTRKSHWVGH